MSLTRCQVCDTKEMCKVLGRCQMFTFEPPPPTTNIAQAVIEDREASHGDYAKQAETARAIKRAFRSIESLDDPMAESLDMIAVKISRILNGDPNNPDHWTDIAGYATLISNLLLKGTHL